MGSVRSDAPGGRQPEDGIRFYVERSVLAAFLLLLGYLALFHQLGALAFLGADEPRYARIGEEMAAGGDWVTPHLLGRPWLEKPPLLFWLEAAGIRLLGSSETAARLPNAVLGWLCALALGWFLGRFAGRTAGVLAYCTLLSMPFFVAFARSASTDLPLAVMLTLALLCIWAADESGRLRWAAAAGIFAGLATLAKGPVTLVLLGGGYYLFSLWMGRWRWKWRMLGVSGVAFLATAAPWYVLVTLENGRHFWITFWLNHHLARFVTDLHHHTQPFWYYLPLLLAGCFPWILALGPAVREWSLRRWRPGNERERLEAYLLCFVFVTLAFFSAARSKLPGYILPVVPAVAALAALQWRRFLGGEPGSYRVMKRTVAATAVLAVLLAGGLTGGFAVVYGAPLVGAAVGAPLLALALPAWNALGTRRPKFAFLTTVAALTCCLSLLYTLGAPIISAHHSARNVCRVARAHVSPAEPLIFYRFYHHSARYYTDFATTWDSIDSPQELDSYLRRHPQDEYFLLTHEAGWRELQECCGGQLVSKSGPFHLVKITP
ncbi:MAG: hypothetical protein Kow00109_09290 [Acidobacteriota bacterium]